MQDLAELLERFRRGPELIAAALTGAAGQEVDFRPEGKWSVRQIAAHLADSELEAGVRFRRILAEDLPQINGYDQDAWAEHLDYNRRKPSQSLESFRKVRADNYELLKDVTGDRWERKAIHSERGETTLGQWLEIYARHAEKHSEQIRRTRDAYKAQKAAAV